MPRRLAGGSSEKDRLPEFGACGGRLHGVALGAWEHVFVTSQGSAHGRFQCALARGQLEQAEMAARELGRLSLIDALSLVVCYARTGSPKFEQAAVRWLGRFALEGRDVRLAEVQLAAAALGCLRGRKHERAAKTLLRLL